jgi:GNAT superfamily N-acetyltransferase
MNIVIRPIQNEDCQRVHAFQCEYLDNESYNDFVTRIQANPDLYLVAFDEDELVGICYGHPSNKYESAINLQGIAVNLDERKSYARKGIGSMMIEEFEKAVKVKGYKKIDVGCADDTKVERFYLKNRFHPYELVAKDQYHTEYERVKISNYEFGQITKEELRKKYRPKEVIIIFEKLIE